MTICKPNDIKLHISSGEKLLGLDIGKKTIGLALSDASLKIASPVKILYRKKFTPDMALVFELLNEPSEITIKQLNAMNTAVLPVVRKSNPTRQVHLGGLAKMGTWWILQNPDAVVIPAGNWNSDYDV